MRNVPAPTMTAPSGRYRPTEPAEVDRVALVRRKVRCKRSRCSDRQYFQKPEADLARSCAQQLGGNEPWRQVKVDWDPWNGRSLADETDGPLIVDGAMVRVPAWTARQLRCRF